jgi:hypothetical protein
MIELGQAPGPHEKKQLKALSEALKAYETVANKEEEALATGVIANDELTLAAKQKEKAQLFMRFKEALIDYALLHKNGKL